MSEVITPAAEAPAGQALAEEAPAVGAPAETHGVPPGAPPSTVAQRDEAELPLVRNRIPGADVLGFGFNVFNDYSTASLLSAIFRPANRASSQWVSPGSLALFDVPANVAVFNDTAVDGEVNVFEDNREYRMHLAVKAGIAGSGTTFMKAYSASFSATASTTVDVAGSSSHWLAVYEANYRAYRLALVGQSMAEASEAFAQDPAVLALPDYFNTNIQYAFFDVFTRFGTHYVAEVEVGGYMNYYATVDKTKITAAASVATSLSAEFKATMVKGKADAEVQAEASASAWASSRSVQIKAGGGDTGPLAALHPMPGDDNTDVFSAWQQSVMVNPSVMNFRLRPISALFSGKRSRAVDQAIAAYTGAFISVASVIDYLPPDTAKPVTDQRASWYARFSMIRNGEAVVPFTADAPDGGTIYTTTPTPYTVPPRAMKWATFKETTLEVICCRTGYWPSDNLSGTGRYLEALYEDLLVTQKATDRYIMVVSMLNMRAEDFPSDRLAMMFRTCGASLRPWLDASVHRTGSGSTLNMIIAGKHGMRPGTACEVYEPFDPTRPAQAELSRTIPLMPEQGPRGFGYRLMPVTLG